MSENNWINSPIITTIVGAVIGAIVGGASSYFFGLKMNEKVRELEKKNEALEQKQKKDSEGIRAEIIRLLEEQEKRVKLEEGLKNANYLCSLYKKYADKHYKENEESTNKIWQLQYILMWHGFKEDIDKIIDGSISELKWEEKSEIQKIKEKILDKRFKCEKCDKCK